jgi:lysophospholipase L1-like esterase
VFLGDSSTTSGETVDYTMLANYPNYASIFSLGRINRVKNAGVSGNTLAQMLARFDTDVTPYNPDVVFLLGGTNDMPATALATSQANVIAIVAKIIAIGAKPVLCTIPPRDTLYHSAITAFNAWITSYAQTSGFDLIDFWTLLADPVTENYKAGYSADGIHPQTLAKQLMGQLVIDTLTSRLTPAVYLPTNPSDPDNLFSNGLFDSWGTAVAPPTISISKVGGSSALTAGTYYYKVSINRAYGESIASNEVSIAVNNGDVITVSIPMTSSNDKVNVFRGNSSGTEVLLQEHIAYGGANPQLYVDSGALTPSGRTPPTVNNSRQPTGWTSGNTTPIDLSQVTDTGIAGIAAHMAPVIASTVNMSKTVTMAGNFAVGDVLALVYKFRTSNGNWPAIQWQFIGSLTYQLYQFDSGVAVPASGWAVFYREITVPASTTALKLFVGLQAVIPQWTEFGQIAVYNLTTLGRSVFNVTLPSLSSVEAGYVDVLGTATLSDAAARATLSDAAYGVTTLSDGPQ